MDCIFCKIVKGEIPSKKAFESDTLLAFHDINPVAPTHILIIPKEHIQSASDINSENSSLVANIFETAARLAGECGLLEDGYRIVTNIGKNGGQSVPHLHFHLIGGRQLQWP